MGWRGLGRAALEGAGKVEVEVDWYWKAEVQLAGALLYAGLYSWQESSHFSEGCAISGSIACLEGLRFLLSGEVRGTLSLLPHFASS